MTSVPRRELPGDGWFCSGTRSAYKCRAGRARALASTLAPAARETVEVNPEGRAKHGRELTMGKSSRRDVVVAISASGLGALALPRPAAALGQREQHFVAEAARMKREAVAAGDQPFGAVIVKDGAIVGFGPSRVVLDRDGDAHAERVALRDAQKRLGVDDMAGTVMYSTSRPCTVCEDALARANVERMHYGADGADGGRPRRWR